MTIHQMQAEILRLKQKQNVCILAHSYQARGILEIADFTGDSFQLSLKAASAPQSRMLLCGVRFMAETVKILSPEKQVLLANGAAGCPMAEQMDKALIRQVKERYPDYTVVAYINTTAELKTLCDVCVTSSSAVDICRKLPDKRILFIPDCNLGDYVAKQVPDKEFKLLSGGCPIHARVHAVQSAESSFIIGTEVSIVEHLSYQCPDKRFYPLSKNLICPNMKLTSLPDVYRALQGGGEEIHLDKETLCKARVCIDRMLELG